MYGQACREEATAVLRMIDKNAQPDYLSSFAIKTIYQLQNRHGEEQEFLKKMLLNLEVVSNVLAVQ